MNHKYIAQIFGIYETLDTFQYVQYIIHNNHLCHF